MPYYFDSCHHIIGMKCIKNKDLEKDGESEYINITFPFSQKKQESNYTIQTTLTQILKDVDYQSITQIGEAYAIKDIANSQRNHEIVYK